MIPKKKKSPNTAATESSSMENVFCTADDTMKKPKKQDAKSREWTCLVYPESAPADWREQLQMCFLETYISPLHDKDINPTGEHKKPHYHVVLAWPGPTTYSNAKTICDSFGGILQPRVVGSLRGVCRYLCHLDNPEKAQYDPADVVCYNGADWDKVVSLQSDKYVYICEMQDFCDKYQIYSYRLLSQYARKHRKDWFQCLCDNGTYVIGEYLKSVQWEVDKGMSQDLDTLEEFIQQNLQQNTQEEA